MGKQVVVRELFSEEGEPIFYCCILGKEVFDVSSCAECFATCSLEPYSLGFLEIGDFVPEGTDHIDVEGVEGFGSVEYNFGEGVVLVEVDVPHSFGGKTGDEGLGESFGVSPISDHL